jgi:acyl carrier protein
MPGHEERLQALFRAVFELPPSADVTSCQQANTPAWDSMAHVSLVAAIESEFGLTIDAGDSLTLTSYESARLYLEGQGV